MTAEMLVAQRMTRRMAASTAQDKVIETLTQLNEKLQARADALEKSLKETQTSLRNAETQLDESAKNNATVTLTKSDAMQVDSKSKSTAPNSKDDEEAKKWKAEAKRLRGRLEEKDNERKMNSPVATIQISSEASMPLFPQCQPSERTSKPKSRYLAKHSNKQNAGPPLQRFRAQHRVLLQPKISPQTGQKMNR